VTITPGSIEAGVNIGEIFVDKYRVDAILGHGGMGIVALCTHLALNEQVAIKMLRRDVLDDADAVERFMREAQAAVKLKSEYVARVSDVGRSRNNVPYMVMEYLEGHDLGDLLDERGNLGLPWAIELTLQACEALAEAHSLGIVHRDVKPTNLFVTWRPDGSPLIKVLDFGISKALTGNAMALTQTQSLLGTPAYMSPEQMRSARNVDVRTDIWSLGTVLYEMLEGRRPFEAESFSEMCVKVAVDPPGAMINTPLALQQVVLRCLEKAPEQRYPSMADLAGDLVPFSQDPHQAQVLVERMSRTLRRSQVVEWNPSQSGVSGPVRVHRSVERPAEPAAIDLAASGAAIPAPIPSPGTGPVAAPPPSALPARRTGSRPSLSKTMSVGARRHRGTLIIAGLAAAAAALGAAISLLQSPAAPEHAGSRGKAPSATNASGSAAPQSIAPETTAPGASAPPVPSGAAEPARPADRGSTEPAVPAHGSSTVAPAAPAHGSSTAEPAVPAHASSTAEPAAPAHRSSTAAPAPGVTKGEAKGAHASQPVKPATGAAARDLACDGVDPSGWAPCASAGVPQNNRRER
jgi:serine/threonine-protein kinase